MRSIKVTYRRSQLTLEKQAERTISIDTPTFCQGDYKSTVALALRTGIVCPLRDWSAS